MKPSYLRRVSFHSGRPSLFAMVRILPGLKMQLTAVQTRSLSTGTDCVTTKWQDVKTMTHSTCGNEREKEITGEPDNFACKRKQIEISRRQKEILLRLEQMIVFNSKWNSILPQSSKISVQQNSEQVLG